jgi:hypothetical protein
MVANVREACVACMQLEKNLPSGPVEVSTSPEAMGAQRNPHVNAAGWARLLLLLPFYPSKA